MARKVFAVIALVSRAERFGRSSWVADERAQVARRGYL